MFLTACSPRNVQFFIWHGILENETTKQPRNARRQLPSDCATYTTSTKTVNAIFVEVKVDGAFIYHSVSDFELCHISNVIRTLVLHAHQTQYYQNASDSLDMSSVHQLVREKQPYSHRGIFSQNRYWGGLLQICLYNQIYWTSNDINWYLTWTPLRIFVWKWL
jgi:hypothetical protein